jgi:hypothetical protein
MFNFINPSCGTCIKADVCGVMLAFEGEFPSLDLEPLRVKTIEVECDAYYAAPFKKPREPKTDAEGGG